MARPRAAATSPTSRWWPSATTWRPLATTEVTSAAVAANTRWSTASAGRAPARRTESRPDRDQVGQAAGGEAAGVPAEGVHARPGGRGQQVGRPVVAAPLGGQPLVQLDRSGLLEQVDHGMAVGAEAERAAGVGQRPGRPDPVGQVALGGRAEAGGGAGGAEAGHVLAGEVGGVHGGGARAQHPGRGGQGGRGAAGGGEAGLVLGPLLGQVQVQGGAAAGGPGGHGRHGRRVDRPHAVDGGPDPRARAGRGGRRPARPSASASPSPKRTWTPASGRPSSPARR